MADTSVPTAQEKMYLRSCSMLADAWKFGIKSRFFQAAALWNIRKFHLYRQDSCSSMAKYIEKIGYDRNYVYSLLREAGRIALAIDLKQSEELTQHDVTRFVEQRLSLSANNLKEKTDAPKALAAHINKEMTSFSHDDGEVDVDSDTLFEDFDESDPEFLAIQQHFAGLRKPKPGTMTKKDPKAALKASRGKGLDLAVEFAQKAAFQLHGLSASTVGINRSEGAKAELLYYVRLTWYYASTPASEVFSGWVDYQTALRMDAENDIKDTRPDVFFGLHENWD